MIIGGDWVAACPDEGGQGIRWLSVDEAPDGEWAFLGYKDGQGYAAVMVDRITEELTPTNLRVLGPVIAPGEASLAVHAVGLARWHKTHTHCARCGAVTVPAQAGHTRICPSCGTEHFPRTDPAVIMLITDDDERALLGRQAAWPEGQFSTLAGFVEPGETLDDAVRREVKEEAGVEVGEVTYAGSQPWPFPSSLMLGFFGKAVSHDIAVDAEEISEANWYTREEFTRLTEEGTLRTPPTVSISGWLIRSWLGGRTR